MVHREERSLCSPW